MFDYFGGIMKLWVFILFQWACFSVQALMIWLVPPMPWHIKIQNLREKFLCSKLIDFLPDKNETERAAPYPGEIEYVEEEAQAPHQRDAELRGTIEDLEMFRESISPTRFKIRLNEAAYPNMPYDCLPEKIEDYKLEARYNNGKHWFPCRIIKSERNESNDGLIQTVKYEADEDDDDYYIDPSYTSSWWCFWAN